MRNYEEILRHFLDQGGKSSLKIKKLPGSSLSDVFICGEEIYKVGPKGEALKEISNYGRFKKQMANYSDVFPFIEILAEEKGLFIWGIEFIGFKDLENEILDLKEGNKEGLIRLEKLNLEVLRKIREIFNSTVYQHKTKQKEQMNLVFVELIQSLRINLEKAGLLKENVLKQLDKIEISSNLFTKNCLPSITHKDLSVGNIIVSEKKKSVYFIDPRKAVPYLNTSRALGNVSVDLIGYYVSVLRKEMELKRKNSEVLLSSIKMAIKKEIKDYEKNHIFNPLLKDLCFLVWFSVYVACKCDYCMSKERVWLYKKMRENTKFYLKKLINILK